MERDVASRKVMYFCWGYLFLWFVLRLLYSGLFLLAPDETNYWQWGRHLDWSYHDQSPMIGWMIHLATLLLGHTERAVRLPSVIAITIASVYLVLIARRWFGTRVAWSVAVLSQSVLLFNVGGLMATADGLQAAAWAAVLYHGARAYEEDTWGQWLAAGTWFGFGMLSKYTMVLVAPCIFGFGLVSPVHRRALSTLKPYAGLALGLALFSPVIYWNASHHWNSIRHVAYIGGANQGFSFHWRFLGDFVASQAALLSPLAFGAICWSWIAAFKSQGEDGAWMTRYLLWTSLPVVAGFAILSLHTRVYGNWPGAGYLAGIVLVAAGLQAQQKAGKAKRRYWLWTLVTSYAITLVVLIHTVWPFLPLPPAIDRTATELTGWDQLGKRVSAEVKSMPSPGKTFIFGRRYQIASELAFYVPGQPFTVSINRWNRPNVYDYWFDDNQLRGMDAVGVTRSGDDQKLLKQIFRSVEPPQPVVLTDRRNGLFGKKREIPVKTLFIYRCFGFKGGLGWIPPDKSDIRAF